MSIKPSTVAASVLAVAEAGSGAGGMEDPLDDVISIFTTIGVTINQCDGIINAHNLTGMDDFDYIRVDDSVSFIKVLNDTSRSVTKKFGMPTQLNL